MKAIFNPSESSEILSGTLTTVYESKEEIVTYVRNKTGLNADEFVDLLNSSLDAGEVRVEDPEPHFLIEGYVESKFVYPYIDALSNLTGDPLDDLRDKEVIDVTDIFAKDSHPAPLKLWLNGGVFQYEVAAEDFRYRDRNLSKWESESARFTYMDLYVNHFLTSKIGVEARCPEFIQRGNGSFYANPDYASGKRREVYPAIGCPALFDRLLNWWLDTKASDLQKEAVKELVYLNRKASHCNSLMGWSSEGYHRLRTLCLPDLMGTVKWGSGDVPRIRILEDLSEESLKDWTPGVNIQEEDQPK